jgi:hypothetical protein
MKKEKKSKKRTLPPVTLETVRLLGVTGGEPTIIVGSDTCGCNVG